MLPAKTPGSDESVSLKRAGSVAWPSLLVKVVLDKLRLAGAIDDEEVPQLGRRQWLVLEDRLTSRDLLGKRLDCASVQVERLKHHWAPG